MRISELFTRAGLEYPAEYGETEISHIVTDSRRVSAGCMFVALRGYNTDGHEHISEAVKNGAVVIVAEQVRDECVGGAAIILIENTRRAAALLYNSWCDEPSKRIKLVGVTGTNGKTSVTYMLKSIFEAAGVRCGVIGTVGAFVSGEREPLYTGGLTTPEAAELFPLLKKMADMGAEYVFMEISSHAIARRRIEGLCFEVGIFTNLTRDHLDFHGSMENYFLTKASLFTKCKKYVVNRDDPYGRRLTLLYGGCITCSVRSEASVSARNVELSRHGARYIIKYFGGEREIELCALGDFSVINSLEAAATALELGVTVDAVAEGLSRFSGAQGRMERAYSGDFDVIIDYAHTPDALERLILSARKIKGERGRTITVFGCGGERDRGKRKEMGRIASRLSDTCVITTDNSRGEDEDEIIRDILKGTDKERPHAVIKDRREAIRYAVDTARTGDIVLIAGKGHERYQIDAHGAHIFDEKQIIKEALAAKR